MLVSARRFLGKNGHHGYVVNGDITHLPFAKKTFHVIFSIGILSYSSNNEIAPILKQLPDLLMPGGFLIVQNVRLDVVTWLRCRLPDWVPRPIRLPGPLYPRKASIIINHLKGTSLQLRKVIEISKFALLPFQTIFLFQKEIAPY